jgi:hypothetical protein
MSRKNDFGTMEQDLIQAIMFFRNRLASSLKANPEAEQNWALIETYAAVSMRVLKQANPSKIRDAAQLEEIKARIHGKTVFECE